VYTGLIVDENSNHGVNLMSCDVSLFLLFNIVLTQKILKIFAS